MPQDVPYKYSRITERITGHHNYLPIINTTERDPSAITIYNATPVNPGCQGTTPPLWTLSALSGHQNKLINTYKETPHNDYLRHTGKNS